MGRILILDDDVMRYDCCFDDVMRYVSRVICISYRIYGGVFGGYCQSSEHLAFLLFCILSNSQTSLAAIRSSPNGLN